MDATAATGGYTRMPTGRCIEVDDLGGQTTQERKMPEKETESFLLLWGGRRGSGRGGTRLASATVEKTEAFSKICLPPGWT